jgi:hypothetical protein
MVTFVAGGMTADELAEWLVANSGERDIGTRLSDWLVNHRAVDDVFASDAELEQVLREESTAVGSLGADSGNGPS